MLLIAAARNGDERAMDSIIRRYEGFVRLKASSYFLAGGDSHDLIQEGLVGLFKAVRDFRSDKDTSFRSFAELCITRQIITAIKTATRHKHAPLNSYVSFSHTPAGQESEVDCTLGDALPGPSVDDPAVVRDLDRGAAEPARLPRHGALVARVAGADLLPGGALATRRSASCSAATPRRWTTPSSGSSARCSRTSTRAASCPSYASG